VRLDVRGIGGAGADEFELARDFRGWAEVVRSVCVTKTEMRDSAFGDDSVHADFPEGKLADGVD